MVALWGTCVEGRTGFVTALTRRPERDLQKNSPLITVYSVDVCPNGSWDDLSAIGTLHLTEREMLRCLI